MAVRNNLPVLTPERAKVLLSEWFISKHTTTVVFREETNPKNDPHDDYLIGYEAIFEPKSLEHAYIHIGVTPDGYVAIGFERWERIAERLGAKNSSVRFAAGHEPCFISESGLLAILDLIANGQIAIAPTVIPLIGLVSTKAKVLQDVLEELISKGYSSVSWLNGVSQTEFSEKGRLLQFSRWK